VNHFEGDEVNYGRLEIRMGRGGVCPTSCAYYSASPEIVSV